MMCASYANLQQEVDSLMSAGADILHLDVMDGHFVPNFGMGLQDVEFIAKNAPSDVHLMIQNPGQYVTKFAELGARIIYIHPEADCHASRTLDTIKNAGASPAIAINPSTSVATIEPLLPLVDYILVMTVNPGYAGQAYLPFVDTKIDRLLEIKAQYSFKIMIDGAVSPERIQTLGAKGVDGFVLGTASLFGKGQTYAELIKELRR